MRPDYAPDRGDVVWLNFSPHSGREQAGHRPALVVSPKAYNEKVGLALCCPITSRIKGYPFEVVLPKGLAANGAVLSDHIKSLDWRARRAEFKGRVSRAVLDEVLSKIAPLLAGGG